MRDHLTRNVALALAIVVVADAGRGHAQQPQPPTPFEQLFAEYATGDYEVVSRTIQTVADFNHLNPPEMTKLRKWIGKWVGQPSRVKAAYLLDLAVTVEPLSHAASINLISEGRLSLVTRHDRIGVTADDDAFEIAWHKTALSLLEEIPHPAAERLYLDTIQHRYPGRPGTPALDPRFVFQNGVAKEQECWQAPENAFRSLPGPAVTSADVSHQAGGGDTFNAPQAASPATPSIDSRNECLAEASRRFIAAAATPALAAEANTRAGWTKFQIGDFGNALTAINRAGRPDDEVVAYWTQLFRARILSALGQDADAAQAYRAAIELAPGAQSPQLGLALLLFRAKKIDEARAAAAEIRQLPSDSVDPWWTYLGADGRFVTAWMADVRKLVR
jgi:hypothetical protein